MFLNPSFITITTSSPHPTQSASVCLTLVDAIDVEMERSAGFAHQPDVVSLLKVEDSRSRRLETHTQSHSAAGGGCVRRYEPEVRPG